MIEPADLFERHQWHDNVITSLSVDHNTHTMQMEIEYSNYGDGKNVPMHCGVLNLTGIVALAADPDLPMWDEDSDIDGEIMHLAHVPDAVGHAINMTFFVCRYQPWQNDFKILSLTCTDIRWEDRPDRTETEA